jgi:predicted nucleic acid-binding protein
MRADFYDSSAFVKLFVSEAGTTAMLQMYASADRRIVSKLAFLEVRSAIRRLELDSSLTLARAVIARDLLSAEAERIEVVSLTDEIVDAAQEIMDRRAIRTLDAIHLATAMSLGLSTELVLVTSDDRLGRAAIDEGLRTKDPRKP